MEILKVQIPIVGDECLIYNENRSIKFLSRPDYIGEIIKAFKLPENTLKFYISGKLDKDGKLHVQDIVEDQPW